MEFTKRHWFGPDGQIHTPDKDKGDLHINIVFQNPEKFGFKRKEDRSDLDSMSDERIYSNVARKGFMRGEYWTEGSVHSHALSHEASGAKPWHFNPALRLLHAHYKKNPDHKFQIQLFTSNYSDENILDNYVRDTTGNKNFTLKSISDIEKYRGMKKENDEAKKVKKITRRGGAAESAKSGLGQEPRMGQGNLTTAEYNFWRRKGLGDSYMSGELDKLLIENYKKSLKEDRAGLEDLWQNPLDPRYPYRPPVSTPADAPKPRPWGHNIVDVGPYNDPYPDFRKPTIHGPNDTLDRYRNPINPPRGPRPIVNNPPSWWQGGLAMWLQYLAAAAPFLFTQQAGGGSPRPGFIGNDDQGWYPIPPNSQWGGSDLEWYRDLLGIKPSEFPGLGLYFDQDGNELVPSVDGPVSNQPLELERRRRYPMPSTQERMFY